MLNNVSIIGRISSFGKYLQFDNTQGSIVLEFNIAYNEVYKGKDRAHFFPCKAWNGLSKVIRENAQVGDKIGLTGKLVTETWVDKASGSNRSKMVIQVTGVELLGVKKPSAPVDLNQTPATSAQPVDLNQTPATSDVPY
jgi:single-stranded DNA-binding protein